VGWCDCVDPSAFLCTHIRSAALLKGGLSKIGFELDSLRHFAAHDGSFEDGGADLGDSVVGMRYAVVDSDSDDESRAVAELAASSAAIAAQRATSDRATSDRAMNTLCELFESTFADLSGTAAQEAFCVRAGYMVRDFRERRLTVIRPHTYSANSLAAVHARRSTVVSDDLVASMAVGRPRKHSKRPKYAESTAQEMLARLAGPSGAPSSMTATAGSDASGAITRAPTAIRGTGLDLEFEDQ
jgi:hypothetical protein